MMALVRRMGQDMALLQNSREGKKTAIRTMILILTAVCLSPVIPFMGISYAQEQEKDTILSDSGIVYPGGYDLNTVGEIQGRVSGIVIPESGPVRITLNVDKEIYIVLASPSSFWKDMDANLKEGTEVSVRGSKTVGKDGKLYIIAQEIKMTGSKKSMVFRSESGEALWGSGSQKGQTNANKSGFGSSSGGFGSSSGSRVGGGSSGKGRGGR